MHIVFTHQSGMWKFGELKLPVCRIIEKRRVRVVHLLCTQKMCPGIILSCPHHGSVSVVSHSLVPHAGRDGTSVRGRDHSASPFFSASVCMCSSYDGACAR